MTLTWLAMATARHERQPQSLTGEARWKGVRSKEVRLSFEQRMAGCWLPLQIAPQEEEFGGLALPPMKLNDDLRTIQPSDLSQAQAIALSRTPRGTALDLDEDDVEEIAALQ